MASIGQLGKILCAEATIASERKRISGCRLPEMRLCSQLCRTEMYVLQ